MASLDIEWIGQQFPSLAQQINGHPAAFLDGPGGSQVPATVIQAISDYLLTSNANLDGVFGTSVRTEELLQEARSATADFLGCDWDEVVFGGNMTNLTFAVSRAIGRELQPGDEIIVTSLDHDANVAPWMALEERGVIVRMVDINTDDCTLDLADLAQKLTARTRLVAVGYASNGVGTINDVAKIVQMAHAAGALTFVDAVHYAPHGPIDVRALDCDFLVCSAYKFFGPHLGIMYGKREHLARFTPYKLRPSPEEVPYRWELGTQNHEGIAGLVAAIDYLTALGQRISPTATQRRQALTTAMVAIQAYERALSEELIPRLLEIPGLTLYGVSDPAQFAWRTPTVSLRMAGYTPLELATALAERGIFAWNGNFYALNLTERLGVESSGGLLRIGFLHYNTQAEVHRLVKILHELAARLVVA